MVMGEELNIASSERRVKSGGFRDGSWVSVYDYALVKALRAVHVEGCFELDIGKLFKVVAWDEIERTRSIAAFCVRKTDFECLSKHTDE